jgi:hypothetical protein
VRELVCKRQQKQALKAKCYYKKKEDIENPLELQIIA